MVLFAISCKQEVKPDYSVINGTVGNNTAETALVRGNEFEAQIPINENGVFTDTLHLKKMDFMNFMWVASAQKFISKKERAFPST